MEVDAYFIAERYIGQKEVFGKLDNPLILAMLKLDNKWPQNDETPWCSAFANWVCWHLRVGRSKSLLARSWLNVGYSVPVEDAFPGWDMVVLKRGTGRQPGPNNKTAPGHVGFFSGLEGNKVLLLGGNQGDSVSISGYSRSRILGVRRIPDMNKQLLLRALIIIVTWPVLFVIYFGLAALGLIVVPIALKMKVDMTKLPIWGNPKGLDWWEGSPFWWYALRNPTGSIQLLLDKPADPPVVYGHLGNLEDKEGIQWQYQYAGWMDEFRVTFGKPDKKKGKNEVLLGWKYVDDPGIAWTIQMRPAWLALFPLALIVWWLL